MEHHRDRDHQTGGGLKRKVEDTEEMKKKNRKGDDDDPSLTVSLEDDVLAKAVTSSNVNWPTKSKSAAVPSRENLEDLNLR